MVALGITQATARCIIAVAVALLVGGLSVDTASAEGQSGCPWEGVGQRNKADTDISLAVAQQLERAINADDLAAALALFADDAVAASSSTKRWQKKSELRDFLTQMRNPTAALDAGPLEARIRCAAADHVVWLFNYPSTGGTGSADLSVHDGRITHIFWTFTPPAGTAEPAIGAAAISSPAPPVASEVTAAACAAVLGLAVPGGLLLRRRHRRPLAKTGDAPRGLLAALASNPRRRSSF